MTFLGSIALLLGLMTGALAQAAPSPNKPRAADPLRTPLVDREVKGRAGRDIRVLVLANVRPDCTSGPLPTVRLVGAPANGKIVVRRGRVRATNVRQCLAIDVPALIATYRSGADFEGSDTVTLEIRPERGKPQIRRITVRVSKADDGSRI